MVAQLKLLRALELQKVATGDAVAPKDTVEVVMVEAALLLVTVTYAEEMEVMQGGQPALH
jgi:hypothetical protein